MIDNFTSLFGLFFGFIWVFALFCMVLGLGAFIFWILMLIDVTKRNFPQKDDKVIWVLVVVLTGVIGALIYYFVIKRKVKKK